jgi:hypothetical protein
LTRHPRRRHHLVAVLNTFGRRSQVAINQFSPPGHARSDLTRRGD